MSPIRAGSNVSTHGGKKERVSNKGKKQVKPTRKVGKSLKQNQNGRGRWKIRKGRSKGKSHQEDKRRRWGKAEVGGLTVVNPLKGIVGGVEDPFSEVLHSLSPGQFLSKRSLPGT